MGHKRPTNQPHKPTFLHIFILAKEMLLSNKARGLSFFLLGEQFREKKMQISRDRGGGKVEMEENTSQTNMKKD